MNFGFTNIQLYKIHFYKKLVNVFSFVIFAVTFDFIHIPKVIYLTDYTVTTG